MTFSSDVQNEIYTGPAFAQKLWLQNLLVEMLVEIAAVPIQDPESLDESAGSENFTQEYLLNPQSAFGRTLAIQQLCAVRAHQDIQNTLNVLRSTPSLAAAANDHSNNNNNSQQTSKKLTN